MTDSRLTAYNENHHDCKTMGELHGLADAMRRELLARIVDADSRVLELKSQLREAVGW